MSNELDELELQAIAECNACVLRGVCGASVADNLKDRLPMIPKGFKNHEHSAKEVVELIKESPLYNDDGTPKSGPKSVLGTCSSTGSRTGSSTGSRTGSSTGSRTGSSTGSRTCSGTVCAYSMTDGSIVHTFESCYKASKVLGIDESNIKKACQKNTNPKKSNYYKGYIWRFK